MQHERDRLRGKVYAYQNLLAAYHILLRSGVRMAAERATFAVRS